MEKYKYIRRILALLTVIALIIQPIPAFAEDGTVVKASGETHYLAFASDRHAPVTNEETHESHSNGIHDAMTGMPTSVEYVCIVGDTVGVKADLNLLQPPPTDIPPEPEMMELLGKQSNMKPYARSIDIYDEVLSVGFDKVTSNDDVAILWGTHDENVEDDAGIIFGAKGRGSGVMKTGYNADGSVAYYVYGVAHYELTNVEYAEAAAEEFMDWVDTLENNTAPIIVLCHVPIHYARGDNAGARYWNLALNYAATGSATDTSGERINRDVVYIFGHNHTVETKEDDDAKFTGEFYVPRGSKMEIGTEENGFSRIYYTYTTAGYLAANTSATLVEVCDDKISLTKYQNGAVAGDGFYDTESAKSGDFATRFSSTSVNSFVRTKEKTRINKNDISGIEASYEYTGEEICPEPVLPDVYKKTENNRAKNLYKVRYKNNINVGKASVVITGNDSYFGAVTIPFNITPKKIEPEIILSNTSYEYDGKEKTPEVTVKDGAKELEPGKDYEVEYSPERIKEGKYKVDVTLMGNYAGKGTAEFVIVKPKEEQKTQQLANQKNEPQQVVKSANTLKVKGKTITIKYSKIKKKAQKLKATKAIKFKDKGQGTKKYVLSSAKKGKKSFKKYFVVNSKTGKVTIKKGLKKGNYKVTLKVSAAGNDKYNASEVKKVTFKVIVK